MRVLLIKMSSLGDVIHALPAVTDASTRGITFDWVVEEAFADIPAAHPGVSRVIPIGWRRWRKNLAASRLEMKEFFSQLRAQRYDLVLDSQGLLKSAAVALMAIGPRHGFSHTVAREPWAAFAYGKGHLVAKRQHAIERQRQLFASALGYEFSAEAHSGLEQDRQESGQAVLLLHGTTWGTKHWPQAMWQRLAHQVRESGYQAVVTWGNEDERVRAQAIAEQTGATVQPRVSLSELTSILTHAAAVVGVDSGLCHLSAALGTPTLGLYGPTDGVLTGCRGQRAAIVQSQLPCAPCMQSRCRNYSGAPLRWQNELVEPACFAELTPSLVWQRTQALMDSN